MTKPSLDEERLRQARRLSRQQGMQALEHRRGERGARTVRARGDQAGSWIPSASGTKAIVAGTT